MQANSQVLENPVPEVLLDWEEARCRAKRLVSKENMVEAGIAAGAFTAFLAVVALVEYSLYQAIQNGSVSGIGTAVFGYF